MDILQKHAVPFQMAYCYTGAQPCLLLSSNRIDCCHTKFHTALSKQDKARHRRQKLVSKLLPRENETYSALSFDIQLPGEIVVSSCASLRSFAPPILRLSLLAQPVNVRHSIWDNLTTYTNLDLKCFNLCLDRARPLACSVDFHPTKEA